MSQRKDAKDQRRKAAAEKIENNLTATEIFREFSVIRDGSLSSGRLIALRPCIFAVKVF